MIAELYRSRRWVGRQRWRWRLVAHNRRVIATSGEAYANRADAINGLAKLALVDARLDVRELGDTPGTVVQQLPLYELLGMTVIETECTCPAVRFKSTPGPWHWRWCASWRPGNGPEAAPPAGPPAGERPMAPQPEEGTP